MLHDKSAYGNQYARNILSEKAGLESHYTNHSLRATAITNVQFWNSRVINCPSNTSAIEPVKEASSEFIPSIASSTEDSSESKPLIGASAEPSAQSLGVFSGYFSNCTIKIKVCLK